MSSNHKTAMTGVGDHDTSVAKCAVRGVPEEGESPMRLLR